MTALSKRVAAALVTALLLCGHVLALLHFVVVPHHVCPEHAGLEHGQRDHDDQAVSGQPQERPTPQRGHAANGSPGGDHHDESCALLARFERKDAVSSARPLLFTPPACAAAAPAFKLTHRSNGDSGLFRAAPKQSPPTCSCV